MGHSKVLISNRGEIAIRIAKAAAGLGIESVSVHPAEDDRSLHTRFTGESVELPPVSKNDPVAAYLNIEAIIEAAVSTGCDCVHPGYGFLAENPRFAERCAEAGLTFIGPSPAALALFGNKVAARDLARSLGVPIIDGSNVPVSSSEVAAAEAERIGYPIMLKAAAGGGGRGMRAVTGPQDLAEAFDRCRSEAEAAFGDGTVFMERLVVDPRHIEVQILADADGNTIHLFERDCSVQQRNQKVVEVAPAAGLDGALRQQILDDAVNLVSAADYANAGTVEFLVSPETGEHFFIECNPRVQVEHTITEQVMAIDIVEAQFHLAAGASLASLGLGDQAAVGEPRGFAVQARVVATGPGTISAYREPSGPGVRVDGAGYLGYTPPPQFDPLLAKVIGSSGFAANLESAVDRTARALAEFHIDGLPTNLIMLQALLANERVRSGDARTTLIGADPNLNGAGSGSSTAVGAGAGNPSVTPSRAPAAGGPLPLLEEQARSITNGTDLGHAKATSGPLAPIIAAGPSLVVADGHRAVEVPVDSTVIEVRASGGDKVNAGDTLLVVNAMKMETTVVAPCTGTIAAMAPVAVDDTVGAGQVIATIAPSAEGDAGGSGGSDDAGAEGTVTEDGWQETLDEVATLHRLALARLGPDSEEPGVVRQRNRNKLDCRQRIDQLLDEGSFREVGSITGFASHDDQGNISAFTPSNHVGGWGDIDGRTAIVCADDFTSRGGHADGAIGEKSRYLDELSTELGVPSVRLLDGSSGGGSVAAMVPEQQKEGESNAKESSGAITAGRPRVAGGGGSFLPGHLGSTMYTKQLTTVPVVNLLLGSVVGIGAAKAVLGHFSVMVRDVAQLFVAGPPVVSHAMGYDITKEDLGGWHIHCRNGSVDNLAESEEEAFDMTRRFLSYLPANVFEPPPVLATTSSTSSPNPGRGHTALEEELATLIPRKRTATFDIRRAIELLADPGSFFEIGGLWGADQVTGFVRFNGHPLGVIASDSRHVNGGALTADGCDKLTRHLDLCDLFHIPVLNLVDNPGFAVGLEHEINGTIRKGAEWMVAFAQVNVPIFTVLMRRSFGVAGNNYATPKAEPSVRVTWPAADVGGIPPEGGIEAAYKRQLAEAEDPAALRAELNARIESVRGPMGPLSKFQIEEMIDPRDTRRYICEWVPNAYRQVARADRLGPRDLQFRP